MNIHNLLLTNQGFSDLNPLIAGEHFCDPDYGVKPQRRNYVLIHSVADGKGTFYTGDKAYPVGPDEAFLILPGQLTHYHADSHDPWHYRWVGFDGSLSKDFSKLPPVFPLPQSVFQDMLRAADAASLTEHRMAAELFRLYARLFSRNTTQNLHVEKVQNYIKTSYMLPIRIEDIAKHLNLDRRYLAWLFKKETGQSMQEYLIQVRVEAAAALLLRGYSVKETAGLVGYGDVANFSKMFKKNYGASPVTLIAPR